MAKTTTRRIKHLEKVAESAGYLLQKVRSKYGLDFGYANQVNQCINDVHEITRVRLQRETREAAQAAKEAN